MVDNGTQSVRRIALVWDMSDLVGARMWEGVYRRAEGIPELVLRTFIYAEDPKATIRAVTQWKPAGLLTRLGGILTLEQLREQIPGLPLVSMSTVPEEVADSIVTMDGREITQTILNHFHKSGLRSFGLFCAGNASAAERAKVYFLELLPADTEFHAFFHRDIGNTPLQRDPEGSALKAVSKWVDRLPDQTGVFVVDAHAGAYLTRVCQLRGRQIPADIQIVSLADIDECVACRPALSNVAADHVHRGAIGLETLMRHLSEVRPPEKVIRIGGVQLIERGSTLQQGRPLAHIATAIDAMRSGAYDGITVGEVMRNTQFVSRATFYKAFKRATGMTPARYLRKLRIDEAKRILVETRLPMSRVAELCGFGSYNYFVEVFHRETGTPPATYRRRQKKEH